MYYIFFKIKIVIKYEVRGNHREVDYGIIGS
jgi:hypothetical protein